MHAELRKNAFKTSTVTSTIRINDWFSHSWCCIHHTYKKLLSALLHFFNVCWGGRFCYNIWKQFFDQLITTQKPVGKKKYTHWPHWYIYIGCGTLLTACNNLLEYKLDFSQMLLSTCQTCKSVPGKLGLSKECILVMILFWKRRGGGWRAREEWVRTLTIYHPPERWEVVLQASSS